MNSVRKIIRAGLFLCGALLASALTCSRVCANPEPNISFNNQIQPILSENCYSCHGPDSASRKPKKHPLRLDREESAFEVRDGGAPVIIKGNAPSSELVRRITASDDNDLMPPTTSEHKKLKPEEIALIEAWINQGAHFQKQWSLIPPVEPEIPSGGKGWAVNPIDRFIARGLEQHGLKPNPDETKARLYRRLSFDLTGLPPTPAALEAFLRDKSKNAYEKAVDQKLASDACAENFARLWLDAVRYADTQGIHHDHARTIWPYRDWVIDAFKTNMPFDQFTVEQIAGDMLPRATLDEQIASGYNRLLPTTGEGGAIPEEYLAIYAKDRTDTTAAVWLGLTTGCATCHDHKFDPIATKDYYALTAFFRNTPIPGLDNDTLGGQMPPLVFVPRPEDRARWFALDNDEARNKKLLEQRKQEARPAFAVWLDHAQSQPPAMESITKPRLSLPLTENAGTNHGLADGKPVFWPGSSNTQAGPFGPAPKVNGGAIVENAAPAFSRNGQASFGAYIYVTGSPNGSVLSRMDISKDYRGWDFYMAAGRLSVHVIDSWPGAALKITAKETIKPGRWHHILAVFDGRKMGSDALTLYVDGRPVEVDVEANKLGKNIASEAPFRLGGRSNKDGIGDALRDGNAFLQDLRFYDRALNTSEAAGVALPGLAREFLSVAAAKRSAEDTNAVYAMFLAGTDEPTQELLAEGRKLAEEKAAIRARGATTLVMEESKDTKPTAYVLRRGNYADKGEKVDAATPPALPPMAADLPRNRLGFARWMVSPENPLTARVTVNRYWSHFFGTGIVETTEDFGVMGARPVNQDLLDWLALDFVAGKWDVRRMAKTIVMSRTYRQSEKITPEKREKDPQNRLCSRGPRVRLDAEEIRDQALAVSGLLVRRVGGPSVKPYQPEGVWESVAMADSNTRVYKQDHGDALYRRSMYTFWKRVAPPASLEILNAPSREVFCTRRERTDTPLQALVTLNDPQFVEAARQLAAKAMTNGARFDARLDNITEPLLGRRMTAEERPVFRKLYDQALAAYQKNPANAELLLGVGESPRAAKLPPAELGAWTLVASETMNLDEALTK